MWVDRVKSVLKLCQVRSTIHPDTKASVTKAVHRHFCSNLATNQNTAGGEVKNAAQVLKLGTCLS